MPQTVGVLAIQGDFEKHIETLNRCPSPPIVIKIRRVEELAKVDRLIIPGGESTTVGQLLARFGLLEAIQDKSKSGLPIWGTCMGMILLAKSIECGRADQQLLGLLDITVRRNAFGAQVHSFETTVDFSPVETPINAVFIRAPIVSQHGDGVTVLATYQEQVVAVRQGNIVGTSFHPELTESTAVHEWFLKF